MLVVERNKIEDDAFTLAILETEEDFNREELARFDCGLEDLNEFFRNDAFAHKEQLLAETYYFQPKEATEEGLFFPVAFVSYCNDSINITRKEREGKKKTLWDSIKDYIPTEKHHYSSFPAVKIARLGVVKEYRGQHFGSALINMTKEFFLTNNRTGCRFLTVDAYNTVPVINFYEKNGFQLYWDKDKKRNSRIMFFDLLRHRGT